MGNIVSSEDMYIYFCRGATWKTGVPATDTKQPFNPIVDSLGIKVSPSVYELITTANSMYPNIHMDKHQEPTTITFKSFYRDPFLLLTIFGYKTIPNPWTESDDIITGAFTTRANVDENICVQIHLRDVSGNCKHVNLLCDGGKVTGYRWVINEGSAMIEEVDIKFAEITENTQPIVITVGFDDESFNATAVQQVSTIVAIAPASLADGEYFTIQGISAAWLRTNYYVYMDKTGDDSGDPAIAGHTGIRIDFVTGDGSNNLTAVNLTTTQLVADEITAAIAAVADFGAANGGGTSTTITVTNAVAGDVKSIADVDTTMTIAVTTSGVIALDGGWALWDGVLCSSKEKVVLTSACTLTAGGVNPPGLHVRNAVLDLALDKEMRFVGSSQTAGITFDKVRGPYKATFSGILQGNDNISEALAVLASKAQVTIKFLYATNKYMQFTIGVLKDIEGFAIPKAGEPIEVTYVYEGAAASALTFYWKGTETTDPTTMINATGI